MKSDIELAFDTISGKRKDLDELYAYANGGQPLKYSTERLAETFDSISARFELNWCSVIVDAVLDRIQLTGFDTPQETVNDKLAELFDKLHLDIEANKIHNAALSLTQGYMIVWKTGEEIEAYYNDPRMCAVIYEDAKPNVKRFAAKQFTIDTGQEMTLYYTDKIEHWKASKQEVSKADAFSLESTEPNLFGIIPVFEFISPGEFIKVITLQDAVNKLFADMMVAAEFGAFVQRYVISQGDPGALKNSPNEIWWLPSGDGQGQATSVGQFATTDLTNYLSAMETMANNMAIITQTPKHYFMNTGANISGEALLAMESPLVKKAKMRQRDFAAQWQDVVVFLLKLGGVTIEPSDVSVIWDRVESIQPLTEAQTMQIGINCGIPLVTILRRNGWTEAELEALAEDQELQEKARKTLAQAVLNDLRIRQEQTNPQQENVNQKAGTE